MRTARPTSRTTKSVKPALTTSAAKPRASRAKKASVTPAEVTIMTTQTIEVSEDAIAVRAYEIFLARNGTDGDPVSDWLQAESELRGVE
jgi:hypothetical protein